MGDRGLRASILRYRSLGLHLHQSRIDFALDFHGNVRPIVIGKESGIETGIARMEERLLEQRPLHQDEQLRMAPRRCRRRRWGKWRHSS